ncbi:hepatic and glial cell adhesion molecule-like [Hemiscyllium ocellatum]|uniref:hepatic and glial cell adhesion molecule-like n=1 Tax=Hemiscyllium ocellatum TaxID=170820 RepID=UPI002966020B|nr:hepatic and glial cell adhesion molecule-like [Hemiscyllium ocellatum]
MPDGPSFFRLSLVFLFLTGALTPIKIEPGLTEFYVIPGHNLTLTANFTVEPKDTIYSGTWRKDVREIAECQLNTSPIAGAHERVACALQNSNISLTLRNFFPNDVGTYTLELVSDEGDKENVQFAVKLYESISTPSVTWNETEFSKGDNHTFTCKIENGTNPQFHWEKDDETLTNDSRHSISESGMVLTIIAINESDCGSYKCVIKNAINQKEVQVNISTENYKWCQAGKNHECKIYIIVGLAFVSLGVIIVWMIYKYRNRQQDNNRRQVTDATQDNNVNVLPLLEMEQKGPNNEPANEAGASELNAANDLEISHRDNISQKFRRISTSREKL